MILPTKFNSHIQSKNTQLFPVILIGTDILLSTNNVVLDGLQSLPILLNIPALKESIDLEKLNYKISNVTLNISNTLHNNKRFSDIVANSSLINKSCRIFWATPQSNILILQDLVETIEDEINKDYPFQIYTGVVRRYTHTDEKVNIVLEDMSQSKLQKDLPISFLSGDSVPEDYKNVPIPMVYGKVDKSPCVISNVGDYNEENESYLGDVKLKIDSNETVQLAKNGTSMTSPSIDSDLFVYLDGLYANVVKIFKNDSIFNNIGLDQYTDSANEITFSVDGDNADISPVSADVLEVMLYGNPKDVTARLIGVNSETEDYTFQATSDLESASGFNTLINPPLINGIENNYNWNSPQVFDVPAEIMNYSGNTGDTDTNFIMMSMTFDTPKDVSDLFKNEIYYKFYPYAIIDYIATQDDQSNKPIECFWVFSGNPIAGTYTIFNEQNSILDAFQEVTGTGQVTEEYSDGIQGYTGSFDSETSTYGDYLVLGSPYNSNTSTGFGNISFRTYSDRQYAGVTFFIAITGNFNDENSAHSLRLKMHYFNYKINYYTQDLRKRKYYANTIGRNLNVGSTQNRWAYYIIQDLLRNELGYTGTISYNSAQNTTSPVPADPGTDPIDFTIDKKINSKKLIENIASVSSLILRFDNMGRFRFNYIKSIYGGEGQESTEIIANDVISHSYSRTKIEDVYTKVIVKYKHDYAEDKLKESSSHVCVFKYGPDDVLNPEEDYILLGGYDGILQEYLYEYYGIPYGINADNTLIIDDDRGKYIREKETANNYAKRLLYWHCNQHLIMKIKLPLKYLSLEVGDIISFDKQIGSAKPYGISYEKTARYDNTFNYIGSKLNGQQLFPYFIVTSTNKTMKWVELEATQLHNLSNTEIAGDSVSGAMALLNEREPININANAVYSDGTEIYGAYLSEENICHIDDPDEDTYYNDNYVPEANPSTAPSDDYTEYGGGMTGSSTDSRNMIYFAFNGLAGAQLYFVERIDDIIAEYGDVTYGNSVWYIVDNSNLGGCEVIPYVPIPPSITQTKVKLFDAGIDEGWNNTLPGGASFAELVAGATLPLGQVDGDAWADALTIMGQVYYQEDDQLPVDGIKVKYHVTWTSGAGSESFQGILDSSLNNLMGASEYGFHTWLSNTPFYEETSQVVITVSAKLLYSGMGDTEDNPYIEQGKVSFEHFIEAEEFPGDPPTPPDGYVLVGELNPGDYGLASNGSGPRASFWYASEEASTGDGWNLETSTLPALFFKYMGQNATDTFRKLEHTGTDPRFDNIPFASGLLTQGMSISIGAAGIFNLDNQVDFSEYVEDFTSSDLTYIKNNVKWKYYNAQYKELNYADNFNQPFFGGGTTSNGADGSDGLLKIKMDRNINYNGENVAKWTFIWEGDPNNYGDESLDSVLIRQMFHVYNDQEKLKVEMYPANPPYSGWIANQGAASSDWVDMMEVYDDDLQVGFHYSSEYFVENAGLNQYGFYLYAPDNSPLGKEAFLDDISSWQTEYNLGNQFSIQEGNYNIARYIFFKFFEYATETSGNGDNGDNGDNGVYGDVTDDGIVNVLDVVALVNIVLGDNTNMSGDVNNDEIVNVLDIVALVNIILE